MNGMSDSQRAVLARLSQEFAAMSAQMARVSATLAELDLEPSTAPPPVAQPMPDWPPPPPSTYYPRPMPPPPPMAPPRPVVPKDPDRNWIGKALAVAGVGVTLIGVVLLLVLAAQAGLLRPELRVAAGGVLGAVLIGVGARLHTRPGGRIGAIALSATGIAALYMDVMAVTTIYHWVAPPVALVVGAIVGGGGLSLARRWDSQHLAVLVLVPLVVLAPVITDGVTLLLIGFMIALSAAALLVQIDRDWLWMHAARTVAVTLPLLVALAAAHFGSREDTWLLGGATGVAALLSLLGVLALGAVTAVAGRGDVVSRWAATGLGAAGAAMFAGYAPTMLVGGWRLSVSMAVSTLVVSVLLAVWAGALASAWFGRRPVTAEARAGWVGAALVTVYALTMFTVTAGVLIAGPGDGFLAGHMAATICWIGLAAGLFAFALRTRHEELRAAPIAGGLVLTSAAMAKLFLFDLGTLDGIFRVIAFIVVGLVLLAMGTGYARSLAARRDESDSDSGQKLPVTSC